MGVSKPTSERWERGKENISGPIAPMLYLLDSFPDLLNVITAPKAMYSMRLYYMYEQRVCTVIDVDETRRKIHITNYTDDVLFCAFGANFNPTYKDYEEFLESRCFPKSRDKMKIMLKALDIPFYDPLLIIEKTEGRMADDCFWIKKEIIYDT